MVIDTRLVTNEIFIDGEGSFNGTVGHDFLLDFSNLGGNAVSGFSSSLVVSVLLTVRSLTLSLALRGRRVTRAGLVLTGNVMITRG